MGESSHRRWSIGAWAIAVVAALIACVSIAYWRDYYWPAFIRSLWLSFNYLGGWTTYVVPTLIFVLGAFVHWMVLYIWPSLERHAGKPIAQVVNHSLYGLAALAIAFAFSWIVGIVQAPVSIQQDLAFSATNTLSTKDGEIAKVVAEREEANRRNENYRMQIEQLTTENVALIRGAPKLSEPEQRVQEIRRTFLQYADKAPTRDDFTPQRAYEWWAGAATLVSYTQFREGRSPTFYDVSPDDTYERLARSVASLRAAALSVKPSDLAE